MLGYVIGIILVLAVFSPVIIVDVFAESLIVDFDKSLYDLGDSLTITGQVLEVGMPVIAMSVYDPDGKILSANNLEITSENSFSKTILLESPFYEQTGEYLVKLDYGPISENYYFLVDGEFTLPEIEDVSEPEIILLYTEKKQYTDKDVIQVTGLVSLKDSPTVLIGIYDPFGMPAGFYFGAVDSNLEFTTSFLVKDGVNFRVDGTYSVKAHYAESEATSFFDYNKVLLVEDDSLDDQTITDEIIEETIPEPPPDVDSEKDEIDNSEADTSDSQTETTETKQTETKSEPTTTTKNEIVTTKTVSDKEPAKTNDVEIKETKIVQEKITPNKIKKENNLTVEDVELGKQLNQIQLECDSSTFTDTISYYDGMGPALYRLCQFDSSLIFFNESLVDNPNDVEILVNKGSTLGKLGYYSEAIVYYDHAIKIDPNFLPAKNNKANALATLGNYDDAKILYNEVLDENPNYLTARQNLAIISSDDFDNNNIVSTSFENPPLSKSTLSENALVLNSEKQKSSNFFDDLGIAFSTLGSLFDFLN